MLDIPVIIISKMEPYIIEGSYYEKELKEWKLKNESKKY